MSERSNKNSKFKKSKKITNKPKKVQKVRVCSAYGCSIRSNKLKRCNYCGDYYCNEHIKAKPSGNLMYETDPVLSELMREPHAHICIDFRDSYIKAKSHKQEGQSFFDSRKSDRIIDIVTDIEHEDVTDIADEAISLPVSQSFSKSYSSKPKKKESKRKEKKSFKTLKLPKIKMKKPNWSKFYNKNIKGFMKFIPIIGLIILALMYSPSIDTQMAPLGEANSGDIFSRFLVTAQVFFDTFDFSDQFTLTTTIILLITLWTGYKYWLLNMKYIKHYPILLKRLIITIMFLVFINNHVKMNSPLTFIFDWILFIASLYLVLAGFWYIAKTIDRINLRSDLYCWGLRILGGIIIFVGAVLFVSTGMALMLNFSFNPNARLMFNNIYWILSLCVIMLGVFMQYRSFRRHPALMIWN
ncbi:MAG: hypothetical protein WC307_03135 [Candidatus Nanoarchaeia archaeon]